jgi:ABC-2 type transport system ATP-binding protein
MSDNLIEAKNLVKRYDGVAVVKGVSFSVARGEIFGLLGPNGAGKTTTILMLLGLSDITEGEARVVGYDPVREPLSVKRRVGYLPDSVGFYDNLTAADNMRYMARLIGLTPEQREQRIKSSLEHVGLTGVADKRVTTFSRGMRQRLGLAEILMKDAQIAILDEPTSGLDPNQIVEIRNLIRKIGHERTKCVVLSTHILPEVEVTCDRAIIINNGKVIAEGTTAELTGFARGADAYHVTLLGNRNRVEMALSKFEMLSNFKLENEFETNKASYVITAAVEKDISEDLFDFAVSNGFKLAELRRDTARLEDIFRTLTTKEEGVK